MNRIIILTATFFVVFLPTFAQCQSEPTNATTALSRRQADDLVKKAHTSAEYSQLAGYFRQQETGYRSKAAVEALELDRRMKITTGPYQKWPRPVDSAQSLCSYYNGKADDAAGKANYFEQLAAVMSWCGDRKK